MQKIFDFFSDNPWISIISFVFTVISLPLGLYWFIKSKKEKKPTFSKQTFTLLSRSLSGLKKIRIAYDNIPIEELSITNFAFWNSGTETIKKEDIVTKNPLVIKTVGNIKIFDYEITHQKEANNIEVEQIAENKLRLTFDFLDLNDGTIIRIFHNGYGSGQIHIEGTIIGAQKIEDGSNEFPLTGRLDGRLTYPINKMLSNKKKWVRSMGIFCGFLFGILYIPFAISFLIVETIYKRFQGRVPKHFKLAEPIKGE